jgi:hypothetical protein
MVLRNLEGLSRTTASCRRSAKVFMSIQNYGQATSGTCSVPVVLSPLHPVLMAASRQSWWAGMRLMMQKVKASPRVAAKTLAWRPADPLRLDAEGSSNAFPRRNRNGHTAKATKALH